MPDERQRAINDLYATYSNTGADDPPVSKVAPFPPSDGCILCRGWEAVSPKDAEGAGCRVVISGRRPWRYTQRWTAFCGRCGRMVGRGEVVPGTKVGWRDPR